MLPFKKKKIMESNTNTINPQHYDKKITPVDYIHANNLNFDEGNIVKYITRHRDKNGEDDVAKCIVYAFFVLQDVYNYDSSKFETLLRDLGKKFCG